MSIYFSNQLIKAINLGNAQVNSIYLGSLKIYPSFLTANVDLNVLDKSGTIGDDDDRHYELWIGGVKRFRVNLGGGDYGLNLSQRISGMNNSLNNVGSQLGLTWTYDSNGLFIITANNSDLAGATIWFRVLYNVGGSGVNGYQDYGGNAVFSS
jgi:hypothetical protein